MAEKGDPGKGGLEPACSWCGRPLSPREAEGGVCDTCVNRLKDAGLSDKEISGRRRKK